MPPHRQALNIVIILNLASKKYHGYTARILFKRFSPTLSSHADWTLDSPTEVNMTVTAKVDFDVLVGTKKFILIKFELMRVKFYGARGSIPVCGKEFQKYGGSTTCISVHRENANRIAIIDAGTGIRNLGKELINIGLKQNVMNIFFPIFIGITYKDFLFLRRLITRIKKLEYW